MIAVAACEETPPARVRCRSGHPGGPVHGMRLITGRGATATPILRGSAVRGRIERFVHALKQGTRLEDRRLDAAAARRTCLAFDAITAFRVGDRTLRARTRPNDPAHPSVRQDAVDGLCVRAAERGFKNPPDRTLACCVTRTGGRAGFHPSIPPGNRDTRAGHPDPRGLWRRHPGLGQAQNEQRHGYGVKSDTLIGRKARLTDPTGMAGLGHWV